MILNSVIKNAKKKTQENNPPISNEDKGDIPWFEQIFGNLNEEKPQKTEIKPIIDNNINKNNNKEVKYEKKPEILHENQNNSEDDFDLRKAIVYSEIINNPFIEKTK